MNKKLITLALVSTFMCTTAFAGDKHKGQMET